jgi:putative phosphoserine phosphatase/1-acylglycerol-3-phosphate O-acyltransferase
MTVALPKSSSGVGAFFDMDHTILRGSSGRLYLRYLRETGRLSWRQWIYISTLIVPYIAGLIDFPRLMGRLMVYIAGSDEAAAWAISAEWFTAMLRAYITDAARERITWHQAQGHRVAIISASTPFAVRPVADELGLGDAYLATRLEVIDGQLTGKVIEPACYGEGKLTLARAYAEEHHLDLLQSYFYSDSHHDLPLLEAVGCPVAVNPNRKLARIAAAHGWPVMKFY